MVDDTPQQSETRRSSVAARIDAVRELPLHRLLGLQTLSADDGNARLEFEVTSSNINPAGALHGGVLYALCDVCAYAGLLGLLDDGQEAVTHDLHVSVMRAARLGDQVTLTAEVIHRGRQIAFIDVRAVVATRCIATARITKSLLAVGG